MKLRVYYCYMVTELSSKWMKRGIRGVVRDKLEYRKKAARVVLILSLK